MIDSNVTIGSSQVGSILYDHLHLTKFITCFVLHHQADLQNAERLGICRQIVDMLNAAGYRLSSKIVTGHGTYIPFFIISTRQESRVLIHEDEKTPTRRSDWHRLCFF